MSASREDKIQTKAEREEKRRQEEEKDRRNMALYTVIGVVVALAAVAMMVWNSGLLQRSMTAVEIDGNKFTAVDVEYYFNSAYSSVVNSYISRYYMYPFDTSTSTKKQVFDQETGETWYDYLMDRALEEMKADVALSAEAKKAGHVVSEEAQAQLDSALEQIDSGWISRNYASRDAYIRAAFGSYMSYDHLLELMEREMLASDYAQTKLDEIDHDDADFRAYYQEHADDLDTFQYSQFLFRARVETQDDEGNDIEMTDEEKAAKLEELKTEQKALAEELKAKLDAGEKAEDLAKEYADQLYSSVLDRKDVGSDIKLSANYAEWLLDSARKSGDTTLSEYDGGTVYSYYVVQFIGRELVETATADVRHILVAAEQDEGASEPTQAQYDAAKAEAEDLLKEWKSGQATEDSFAELAKEHSADSGSASNGGLISDISTESTYVETFMDWALDAQRKTGDTGIIQNTGSSVKGWHVMYFVGNGDPIWKQTVADALEAQDYSNLVSGASEGWTLNKGVGMNFVNG